MQFSEKKAAQVAAFFLYRAQGPLEILKLMKLMYLAERASYQKFGEPMIGDRLVSMDNGPVLSITLNHMNRFLPSQEGGWESWVSAVWKEYGHLGPFQLADLTHRICPEWEDPRGSSLPISRSRLLRSLGFDDETSKALGDRIEANRRLDIAFSQ